MFFLNIPSCVEFFQNELNIKHNKPQGKTLAGYGYKPLIYYRNRNKEITANEI